jgi:separase
LASQRGVESKVGLLQTKLERVFTAALVGAGTDKRVSVRLDDALLKCFATLPSTTSEDEIEDLVYFILDVYGFHGVPVAIAELDIDQVSNGK